MPASLEDRLRDRACKREMQLKELARLVINEVTDPSPELSEKLIAYTNGKFDV